MGKWWFHGDFMGFSQENGGFMMISWDFHGISIRQTWPQSGQIHHFRWENSLFQWPFSMAMLVLTRGYDICLRYATMDEVLVPICEDFLKDGLRYLMGTPQWSFLGEYLMIAYTFLGTWHHIFGGIGRPYPHGLLQIDGQLQLSSKGKEAYSVPLNGGSFKTRHPKDTKDNHPSPRKPA